MKSSIVCALALAGIVACADTVLAALIESQPGKPEVQERIQFDTVMQLLAKERYDEALGEAQKAIQTAPGDPRGYAMEGAAYYAKQDYKKARLSFEKALSVNKDYDPALMSLAEIDLREKNYPSARDRYKAVLSMNPENAGAMLGMAIVESANKNESESIAWVERAKLARPDSPGPRLFTASRYFGKREYENAITELNEALRQHPNQPQLLDLLGQVQAAMGKNDDAVSTFKTLVALTPQFGQAYLRLAGAQIAASDISGARVSLQQALALRPDDIEALSILSAVESRSGKPGEALQLAKKVQAVSPTNVMGFVLEGDALVAQKQYLLAAAAYEKALVLRPTGVITGRMHIAYRLAGDGSQGDAKLRDWMKAHPEDTAAPLYVAMELSKAHEQISGAVK